MILMIPSILFVIYVIVLIISCKSAVDLDDFDAKY